MLHRYRLLSVVVAAALCGCVPAMSLQPDTPAVDVSKQSLLLMSVDVANGKVPACIPEAMQFAVEGAGGQALNFRADAHGLVENRVQLNSNRYYMRVALDPGAYTVRGVHGICRMFPFTGNWFLPIHGELDLPPGQVVYAGRVKGVTRDRADADFRAGAVIPLIDQASVGMSNGTWDVTISDAASEDIPALQRAFPALQKVEVRTLVLPPFDRQEAYTWWDTH